ncbi:MAG: phage tail tape measure protein, partial [Muribaculaceae bacterium]|nr:phage tail tape measure protein [Muribaculaceae bacterium]
MKAANTMAGKDAAGFSALKKEVTGLAKDIPLLREELAGGLYQVISNGVPEDNWISFLEASARSAVGGMADLGTAVTVTSTIIKNYGLEWDKAREIQDKIQLTAKNGVTSFEQLAAALPKVTGNAATLGVGIDELMASFATLTGVSGNTAEVATQMAAIFTALVKPSSEATKMAEEMGIRFDAAAIQAAGGFQNFIEQLKGDVQSFAQSSGMLEQTIYSRLFGSAESVRALIPLTGELSEKFAENVAAMKDSAGTMDAAFNEMATTGEAKTQLLKNALAGVRDFFAGMTSWALPLTSISSGALSTVANLMTLTNAFKKFGIAAKISNGITNTLIFT